MRFGMSGCFLPADLKSKKVRVFRVHGVLARSLATQFGAFSVTNDLKTDAEMQALLEKHSE